MSEGVDSTLFPNGVPTSKNDHATVLTLYQMMVASSERLVDRRQGVNTFFLTINGAIVAAAGFVLGTSITTQLQSAGLAALTIAGAILAFAWWSLLVSFGQLNTGKFEVINVLERQLPASIYTAEWKALGEGNDPKKYRSFTSREVWVPRVFLVVYGAAFGLQVLTFFGLIDLPAFFTTISRH